jgi:hypothetical protein
MLAFLCSRLEAYVAKSSGTLDQYTHRVKTLINDFSNMRNKMKNPDQNMRQTLVKIFKKENISGGVSVAGAGGVFGSSAPQASGVGGLFGGNTSTGGLFGGPSSATSSGRDFWHFIRSFWWNHFFKAGL